MGSGYSTERLRSLGLIELTKDEARQHGLDRVPMLDGKNLKQEDVFSGHAVPEGVWRRHHTHSLARGTGEDIPFCLDLTGQHLGEDVNAPPDKVPARNKVKEDGVLLARMVKHYDRLVSVVEATSQVCDRPGTDAQSTPPPGAGRKTVHFEQQDPMADSCGGAGWGSSSSLISPSPTLPPRGGENTMSPANLTNPLVACKREHELIYGQFLSPNGALLTKIILADNPLLTYGSSGGLRGCSGIGAMIAELKRTRHCELIEVLDFTNCGIGDDGCRYLAQDMFKVEVGKGYVGKALMHRLYTTPVGTGDSTVWDELNGLLSTNNNDTTTGIDQPGESGDRARDGSQSGSESGASASMSNNNSFSDVFRTSLTNTIKEHANRLLFSEAIPSAFDYTLDYFPTFRSLRELHIAQNDIMDSGCTMLTQLLYVNLVCCTLANRRFERARKKLRNNPSDRDFLDSTSRPAPSLEPASSTAQNHPQCTSSSSNDTMSTVGTASPTMVVIPPAAVANMTQPIQPMIGPDDDEETEEDSLLRASSSPRGARLRSGSSNRSSTGGPSPPRHCTIDIGSGDEFDATVNYVDEEEMHPMSCDKMLVRKRNIRSPSPKIVRFDLNDSGVEDRPHCSESLKMEDEQTRLECMIAEPFPLVVLNLEENFITDASCPGLQHVMGFSRYHSTSKSIVGLQEIRVGHNAVGDDGFFMVVDGLRQRVMPKRASLAALSKRLAGASEAVGTGMFSILQQFALPTGSGGEEPFSASLFSAGNTAVPPTMEGTMFTPSASPARYGWDPNGSLSPSKGGAAAYRSHSRSIGPMSPLMHKEGELPQFQADASGIGHASSSHRVLALGARANQVSGASANYLSSMLSEVLEASTLLHLASQEQMEQAMDDDITAASVIDIWGRGGNSFSPAKQRSAQLRSKIRNMMPPFLGATQYLTVLDLSHTTFGDDGAKSLFGALSGFSDTHVLLWQRHDELVQTRLDQICGGADATMVNSFSPTAGSPSIHSSVAPASRQAAYQHPLQCLEELHLGFVGMTAAMVEIIIAVLIPPQGIHSAAELLEGSNVMPSNGLTPPKMYKKMEEVESTMKKNSGNVPDVRNDASGSSFTLRQGSPSLFQQLLSHSREASRQRAATSASCASHHNGEQHQPVAIGWHHVPFPRLRVLDLAGNPFGPVAGARLIDAFTAHAARLDTPTSSVPATGSQAPTLFNLHLASTSFTDTGLRLLREQWINRFLDHNTKQQNTDANALAPKRIAVHLQDNNLTGFAVATTFYAFNHYLHPNSSSDDVENSHHTPVTPTSPPSTTPLSPFSKSKLNLRPGWSSPFGKKLRTKEEGDATPLKTKGLQDESGSKMTPPPAPLTLWSKPLSAFSCAKKAKAFSKKPTPAAPMPSLLYSAQATPSPDASLRTGGHAQLSPSCCGFSMGKGTQQGPIILTCYMERNLLTLYKDPQASSPDAPLEDVKVFERYVASCPTAYDDFKEQLGMEEQRVEEEVSKQQTVMACKSPGLKNLSPQPSLNFFSAKRKSTRKPSIVESSPPTINNRQATAGCSPSPNPPVDPTSTASIADPFSYHSPDPVAVRRFDRHQRTVATTEAKVAAIADYGALSVDDIVADATHEMEDNATQRLLLDQVMHGDEGALERLLDDSQGHPPRDSTSSIRFTTDTSSCSSDEDDNDDGEDGMLSSKQVIHELD